MAPLRWLLLSVGLCLLVAVAAAPADEKSDPTLGEDLSYRAVLDHAKVMRDEFVSKKAVKGPTLAYITPWNRAGYEMALRYPAKFTHLSPTWYELVFDTKDKSRLRLNGDHDVDQNWIRDVRANAKVQEVAAPKILPRVLINPASKIYEPNNLNSIIPILMKELKRRKQNFDGFVLDTGYCNHQTDRETKMAFWKDLAKEMHAAGAQLMMSASAVDFKRFLAPDFAELAPHLDGFSLMTYDFTDRRDEPGSNSPMQWCARSVLKLLGNLRKDPLRSKILMGMPMYGYDYEKGKPSEAILGNTFIKYLEQEKPKLRWDKDAHEHWFTFQRGGIKHTVYYPTLRNIMDRVKIANELGVGISIWEIGQGLPYFYEAL
jgi:chitinase domain-containing protein 1